MVAGVAPALTKNCQRKKNLRSHLNVGFPSESSVRLTKPPASSKTRNAEKKRTIIAKVMLEIMVCVWSEIANDSVKCNAGRVGRKCASAKKSNNQNDLHGCDKGSNTKYSQNLFSKKQIIISCGVLRGCARNELTSVSVTDNRSFLEIAAQTTGPTE
jgi:hypothetical protein